MKTSRRRFIRQVLMVGPVAMTLWFETDSAWAEGAECSLPDPGDPLRFIPNEPTVRTRYSAAELADPSRAAQLASFRSAIGKIRALPPDDVISWTKQIAQHCIHCARSNTENIHYDWLFLPWHRAFLYFLERIARNLQGDDDLRLVYWDWENPQSRTLPTIYAPSGQPLYWKKRNLKGDNWPLPDSQVNVRPLLAIPDFTTFGGSAEQKEPVPAAYSGPHANVHNAFSPGDMGDLQYSPRDPVFYAHHGNIDRLWSSWVAAGHDNPDFGDAKVYFYDENRVWRYMFLNDLRDERALGYEYSSLMSSGMDEGVLKMSTLGRQKNTLAFSPEMIASLKSPDPEFLVIENMSIADLPADAVNFGVFVGTPKKGTESSEAKGFLGMASRVLSSGHDHSQEPLSTVFEVTDRLASLAEKGKGGLDLHVAALDARGRTITEAIPLVARNVHIIR